ncbi:MAG: lysophospholipase [Proteobacteria bacterium ST_bin14]|nr:MAG: lysophospholipase [Proteobacteria bacterium ST_bin14]
MKLFAASAVIAAILFGVAPAAAQTDPAAAPPAVSRAPDYTQDGDWLCRPGRADACAADQSATVIAATGKRTAEPFVAAAAPKFDCFYVYPTVSLDKTANSDLEAGPEEKQVAAFQAARFAKNCRVFAPIYRQVTLTALQAIMAGQAVPADRAVAYADVRAAWYDYLRRDNGGRGVVLIGHSQGAGVLKQLLMEEIDRRPVAGQLISAMLIGTNVAVPEGRDVGGDLKTIPLCRRADQWACVVSYVTFRADSPPPANSRFGVVAQPGMVAACTNPAMLAGGKAITDNYLGATGAGIASAKQGPWTADGAAVTTPFVKAPGLLSAECVANGKFRYLAVTVNAVPSDPRTDTIVGDVSVGGQVLADWGLHLIDMPVVMGNLITLSATQAKTWLKRPGAR